MTSQAIQQATEKHQDAIRDWLKAKKETQQAREKLNEERNTRKEANEYQFIMKAERDLREAKDREKDAETYKDYNAEKLEEAIEEEENETTD